MTTTANAAAWQQQAPPVLFTDLQAENAALKLHLEQALTINEQLRTGHDQDYEKLVDIQDLTLRMLGNKKVSPAYKCLYQSLVAIYPALLDGIPQDIEPWRVREAAGWLSAKTWTNFCQDMQAIGAFTYEPGRYDEKANERIGNLVPAIDTFPYPELFDTVSTEKRKKAREAEQKKRSRTREAFLILQCQACGSSNMLYGLKPKCGNCGYQHEEIEDIPVEWLSGKPEKNEPVDQDFDPLNLQAPARDQIEPSVSVTKGEQLHESEPSSHVHYNERSAIVVKGEPQVPSNTATNVIPFVPTAVPHCKHMNCLLGSNRTQPRFDGVYYCPIHRGFIDEKGQPL